MVLKPIVGTPEWLDRSTSLLQNREAMEGILGHLLSLNYYHRLSSRWKSQQYVFLSKYNCQNTFMAALHQHYVAISYCVLRGLFLHILISGFSPSYLSQGFLQIQSLKAVV